MKIIISADGRKLCASTNGQPLTSGSVGIEAAFVLSADYDGLAVTAVFRAGDVSVDVLLTGPSCTVPWEVLETSGHVLIVGVVGKNGSGEIVIPTIWGRVGMVECGTVAEGIDPQDPTPDIAAQLLQIAQETVARAETAETAATEAAEAAGESATAAGEAKTDAETAAQDAEAARQAIEDLSVEAHEDPDGPSVEKTVDPETGAVTLDFGIPPAPEVPVQSVNGKTGAVQLTLDDIPDGEIYARTTPAQVQQIGTNANDIDAIEEKVPAEASAQNQLADKAFVNSALAPYRTASDQDVIDDAQDDRLDDLEQATTTTTIGPAPIVTFDASAADMPLKQLVVDIEPVQAGSGDPSPTNVRPISGWTGCNVYRSGINVWDEDWELGSINDDGILVPADNRIRSKKVPVKENTDYFVAAPSYGTLFWYDSADRFISYSPFNTSTGFAISTPLKTSCGRFIMGTNYGTTYKHDISINYPVTDTQYHPYIGANYPINFPGEAGTVYGGTLDAANKMLYVNYEYVDLGQCIPSSGIVFDDAELGIIRFPSASRFPHLPLRGGYTYCSIFKGTTAVNAYYWDDNTLGFTNSQTNLFFRIRSSLYVGKTPAEVADMLQGVYAAVPLFEPIEISLSDVPNITTLLGTNNFWADCGDVTVTYGAYLETLKASLDRTNGELDTLRACIAPIEDGATASQAYAQGAYFFRNGQFCTALTAISSGASFTLGTNYQATTVAAALIALQS